MRKGWIRFIQDLDFVSNYLWICRAEKINNLRFKWNTDRSCKICIL